MKIRIYPADCTKNLSEMTTIGRDSSGGYYMIDVAHIAPDEEESREAIHRITWNNVDFKNKK